MKHTTGPWNIAQYSIGAIIYKPLLTMNIEIASVKSNRADDESGNADARLIAAAPDLLEAGQALFKAAREGQQNIPMHLVESWGMLFKAIAKAEGREGKC